MAPIFMGAVKLIRTCLFQDLYFISTDLGRITFCNNSIVGNLYNFTRCDIGNRDFFSICIINFGIVCMYHYFVRGYDFFIIKTFPHRKDIAQVAIEEDHPIFQDDFHLKHLLRQKDPRQSEFLLKVLMLLYYSLAVYNNHPAFFQTVLFPQLPEEYPEVLAVELGGYPYALSREGH